MIIKKIVTRKDGFFKGHIFEFNNDGYEIISGLNGSGKTLLMKELSTLNFNHIDENSYRQMKMKKI